ncbi:MAG: S-layer protein [Paenibacillaceae bacterium]|nr:S-layer protein [Paenibacillaceae bacterium]
MSKRCKKWISALLALSMLIVFVPVSKVQAAASLSITSLYTTPSETTPGATDDAKISRVTSNPIQVTATIFDIAESDLPNIYYEVTNVTSGVVTAEKSDRAVKTGTSEIMFQSVELTEGLNRVVIKLGSGTSTLSSQYGWVYFTPSTTISGLKINNEEFVEGAISPKEYSTYSPSIVISGTARNATVAGAYNVGLDSFEKTYIPDSSGTFYFIGGDSSNSMYVGDSQYTSLRGGDNFIRFEARNGSSTFKLEKNIIFNNGGPFSFQTKLYPGTSGTDADLLARQLTMNTQALTLDTKVKVDIKDSAQEYPRLNIGFNSSPEIAVFDLNSSPTVVSTDTGFVSSVTELTYLPAESNAYYNVYKVKLNLTAIPNLLANNKLIFTFSSATDSSSSILNFAYVNPNEPVIYSVARSNGTLLSEGVANDIGALPETLVVTTNDKATGVRLYIDDVLQANPTNTGYVYTFPIDQLNEGTHVFSFRPLNSSGEYSLGSKTYQIRSTNSPYIVVKNIYNGLILDGLSAINTKSGEGIQGGVQNYAAGVTGNRIKAFLNSTLIGDTGGAPGLTLGTDKSFTLPVGAFNANDGSGYVEGKNLIRFEVYIGGNLIRTQSYEIYAFTKKTPYFQNLLPVDSANFILAQTKDRYATKASKVTFSGYVYNASSVEMIKYYKENDVDRQDLPVLLTLNNNPQGGDVFTTPEIPLPAFNSDVRFEFIARNAQGLSATTSITITREPVPYNLVAPNFITNAKGDLQANINGNFVNVIIEADNADSVQIGKEQAVLLPPSENGGRYLYKALVKDLKAGSNSLTFTITRGKEKTGGKFIVYNNNINDAGAAYLLPMSSSIKAFNTALSLSFPKGTALKRAEPDFNTNDSYLTDSRRIMLGIANSSDGRVNQYNVPPNPLATSLLTSTNYVTRFSPASPLFWIDGGEIEESIPSAAADVKQQYRQRALAGSGLDPYESTPASPNYFLRHQRNQFVPTAGGELTLKFDPNIRYEAWRYVTVFRFSIEKGVTGSSDTKGWTNIGGVVEMGKNTITVPFDRFGYYQVMYMDKSYDDVTTHGYARDALDILHTRGIMNGKSDYTFSTTESITRGEFAEALVKVFEIPLNYSGNPTFADVPWAYKSEAREYPLAEYKYIETAARVGIVRGTAMNYFGPDRSITREDASVMIARAAELKLDSDLNKASAALVKAYTDGATIQTYAAPSVQAITKAGFIEGIANVLVEGAKKETVRFEPGQNLSRADASMILTRVLKQQKKIPK